MRIVTDTNILIRMLIAPSGFVANLFYRLKSKHELYISYSSFEEIARHKTRLLKLSKLNNDHFDKLLSEIISGITIVSLDQISNLVFFRAFGFTTSVDYDDSPFVATALFIDGFLWTSDKVLFAGLKKKGFSAVLNNADIAKLID